jgi:hypothetical protein
LTSSKYGTHTKKYKGLILFQKKKRKKNTIICNFVLQCAHSTKLFANESWENQLSFINWPHQNPSYTHKDTKDFIMFVKKAKKKAKKYRNQLYLCVIMCTWYTGIIKWMLRVLTIIVQLFTLKLVQHMQRYERFYFFRKKSENQTESSVFLHYNVRTIWRC